MDSSIKNLTITGITPDNSKPRRSVMSRKKRQDLSVDQERGEIEPPSRPVISLEQLKSIQLPQVKPQPHSQQQVPQPHHSQQHPPQQYPPQQQTPQHAPLILSQHTEIQEGGKVILKPAKNIRVKLQPKAIHTQPVHNIPAHHTRKARRIKLNVGNLSHRFTRAKKVKDDTEKKPIDTIRGYLIDRGVIQGKSKAPERMLRSMYSDFMLLKDQAL